LHVYQSYSQDEFVKEFNARNLYLARRGRRELLLLHLSCQHLFPALLAAFAGITLQSRTPPKFHENHYSSQNSLMTGLYDLIKYGEKENQN
jgi:hypothetical protein